MGHCAIYLSWRLTLVSFGFARYTVLTSPNKDETAVHGYGPIFIGGSCRVGVSQSHLCLRIISLAVMFVYTSSLKRAASSLAGYC